MKKIISKIMIMVSSMVYGDSEKLILASYNGNVDVVRELLKAGASIDKVANDGLTPLMSAAAVGHLKVVKELLEFEADRSKKDNKGYTAFRTAVVIGYTKIDNYLIQYKNK